MMDILLVGNTGFIGQTLYEHLDQRYSSHLTAVSTKEVDLTKPSSHIILAEYMKPATVVIMCAGVKKQVGDTLETFEANTTIIGSFCRALTISRPKRVIYFSSASVYGEDVVRTDRISENTVAVPRTYYGAAKQMAEWLIGKSCAESNTQLVSLRPPLVYGYRDSSKGYGPTGFLHGAIEKGEITLWGDGSELREFIYVDDLGVIVDKLLTRDVSGPINVVSGMSYSYRDVLDCMNKRLDLVFEVNSKARSKAKVDHNFSGTLIRDVVGGFEFTSLEMGMKLTLEAMSRK